MGEQQNLELIKALLRATEETQKIINKQLEKMIDEHNKQLEKIVAANEDIFKDHNKRITTLEKWMWRITGATVGVMAVMKVVWK